MQELVFFLYDSFNLQICKIVKRTVYQAEGPTKDFNELCYGKRGSSCFDPHKGQKDMFLCPALILTNTF